VHHKRNCTQNPVTLLPHTRLPLLTPGQSAQPFPCPSPAPTVPPPPAGLRRTRVAWADLHRPSLQFLLFAPPGVVADRTIFICICTQAELAASTWAKFRVRTTLMRHLLLTVANQFHRQLFAGDSSSLTLCQAVQCRTGCRLVPESNSKCPWPPTPSNHQGRAHHCTTSPTYHPYHVLATLAPAQQTNTDEPSAQSIHLPRNARGANPPPVQPQRRPRDSLLPPNVGSFNFIGPDRAHNQTQKLIPIAHLIVANEVGVMGLQETKAHCVEDILCWLQGAGALAATINILENSHHSLLPTIHLEDWGSCALKCCATYSIPRPDKWAS
jgi:hypothetical protein